METNRSTGLKDFKDLKLIGKGSFGRVFRAVRPSDNQEYAIKEVNIKAMSQREREDAVNEVWTAFHRATPSRQHRWHSAQRRIARNAHHTSACLACAAVIRGSLDHRCTMTHDSAT